MQSRRSSKFELEASARLSLVGVWSLILAPVVAHGLWRPLLVGLDGDGDARWITLAALLVATAALLGQGRWPARARMRWGSASATAIVVAALLGGSGSEILAALASLLAVAGFTSATLPIMLARVPVEVGGPVGARARRAAIVATLVLGSLAVIQTARLATFMGDAERTEFVVLPPAEHISLHACSTAYFEAAKLADARVDNLYDERWWPALSDDPLALAEAEAYAPFGLDTYAYPPQFLLLPRLLLVFGSDFAAQRALWFGLNGLWLAFGLWFVAAWIGETDGRAGLRALLFAPLIWIAFPDLVTLQVGNVHLSVIVAAIVGMIAFERRRPALGGALLAFAILAKISPGLLGIVLLVQRRWRDALWTAGFGLAWSLLALALFGPAPFEAFLRYELPRLSSGEALEFFAETLEDVVLNMAPFGLPFKLERLGVGFDDVWASAATLSTIFTIVALVLTIVAGLREGDRRIQLGLALAVVTLGCLRSPFAPAYVGFSALWLLSLWAAEIERARGVVGLAFVVLVLNGVPPLPSEVVTLVISIAMQMILLGVVVWFVVRPTPPGRASIVGTARRSSSEVDSTLARASAAP
ncbi:glycosyltransferase family 87 protein [Nannocystaceae bacterium ST9]